jgi:uncharacterized protein YdcH (DUF465 family)
MNFDQLKNLVRKLGGVLVLNGDKPEFVILSYDQYQKIDGATGSEEKPAGEGGEEAIERLNREILALKEEIRQKESAELVENVGGAVEEEPIADPAFFE